MSKQYIFVHRHHFLDGKYFMHESDPSKCPCSPFKLEAGKPVTDEMKSWVAHGGRLVSGMSMVYSEDNLPTIMKRNFDPVLALESGFKKLEVV